MQLETDAILAMREELLRATVLENPYIPWVPSTPQALFLLSQEDEVLYGGAAGGGKSVALLAAALQFVMMPQYDALLLRRSFSDLTQPRALIPLSFEWLSNTDADWSERDHRWSFPSGATVTFGHMNSEKDKYNYQGAAYHFVGFDELTQFSQTMYTYLFSRVRKGMGVNFPGRVRSASNPGGEGHEWVKSRFLASPPFVPFEVEDDETHELSHRLFIPAKLDENPHINQKDYRRKLGQMDPVTRMQLLRGDWDVRAQGNMFKREWFKIVDELPPDIDQTVRAWDFAATAPEAATNPDPDWSCGTKMHRTSRNKIVIEDVRRLRGGPGDVLSMVKQTANEDGQFIPIRIEQEPGSAGKTLIYYYANQILPTHDVRAIMATGKKEARASPFSAACSRGDVTLLRGAWNTWWLDHVVSFPCEGMHDDPVDSPAHAFNHLMEGLVLDDLTGPVGVSG